MDILKERGRKRGTIYFSVVNVLFYHWINTLSCVAFFLIFLFKDVHDDSNSGKFCNKKKCWI